MPELLESACDLERVAFIFNPASGVEDMETRRSRLEALAHEAGLTCDLTETDEKEGAAPLAREAVADGMERVIVSGGDGSVMEAAGALAGTETALAVVPGGTGNLLALNLGIPTDAADAIRIGLTGGTRRIDVGNANGETFLLVAGMGADARMIRDADRELKNRLGFLAYFVAAIRHLKRPRVRYTLTIDGRTIRRRAQTVLVANLGRITAGLEIVPGADPEDGILEVAVLRARTPRDYLNLAVSTLLGRVDSDPLLEIHHGREVVVETETPQPWQIDGNEAGTTDRLEVRVEPGALQVVLPAGPIVPVTPAEVAGAAVQRSWLPAVAGAATVSVLCLEARRRRRQGKEPGLLAKHPFLAGAVVAGVSALFTGRAAGLRPQKGRLPSPTEPLQK